ncbi:MAG: GlsB/YeaQ/YmgE family stress response membrane protein [Devosia sp.]
MVGVGWILAILLGGLAGWIAEKVTHSNMGLLMNIILGIVGAVVGNFLLTLIFGATAGGIFWQLVIAVVGACLLIAIVRAISGGRHHVA